MTHTYLNPVYNHSFPDPFVLKYCGEYWAYCTGEWGDGRRFGVLRSRDLVSWQAVGGALIALDEPHPHYWAPEVTYANGRFYLYYSVGDEATMQMRVAVADHPAGPFVDSGRRLTGEPFAIDGHVLIDDDGTWHLFYATDFLDRSHIGTGTVRARLIDPFTLAGERRPVTLPRYDWHVYDPQRIEKGGVRWHTIEGSFVLKHKRRYYQMFSGGNWQNLSYGVGYAVAERPDQDEEWRQVADGARVLPVLRTIPGQVIGPGHNSVVRGPDNVQLYCVYHRWSHDSSARVMAIDPLEWAGERMLVHGPSTAPQPAPNQPLMVDFFDQNRDDGLGTGWQCFGGRWSAQHGVALQALAEGRALAERVIAASSSVIVEASVRAMGQTQGRYGLAFGDQLAVLLAPAQAQLIIRASGEDARFSLPADFDASAFHLLRVEIAGRQVKVLLDQRDLGASIELQAAQNVERVGFVTEDCAAAFAGFALTLGWQELFADAGQAPAELGWQAEAGWRVDDQLLHSPAGQASVLLSEHSALEAYELVVNVRLDHAASQDGAYGCYPAMRSGQRGPLCVVERAAGGWVLACRGDAAEQRFALPNFDAASFQQLRFRKRGERLAIEWEALPLGEIAVAAGATQIGLYARGAAAFDMVRVTALAE